jgi:hypothetical protein
MVEGVAVTTEENLEDACFADDALQCDTGL